MCPVSFMATDRGTPGLLEVPHGRPAEVVRDSTGAAGPPRELRRHALSKPLAVIRAPLFLPSVPSFISTTWKNTWAGPTFALTGSPRTASPSRRFRRSTASARRVLRDDSDWTRPPTRYWIHHVGKGARLDRVALRSTGGLAREAVQATGTVRAELHASLVDAAHGPPSLDPGLSVSHSACLASSVVSRAICTRAHTPRRRAPPRQRRGVGRATGHGTAARGEPFGVGLDRLPLARRAWHGVVPILVDVPDLSCRVVAARPVDDVLRRAPHGTRVDRVDLRPPQRHLRARGRRKWPRDGRK